MPGPKVSILLGIGALRAIFSKHGINRRKTLLPVQNIIDRIGVRSVRNRKAADVAGCLQLILGVPQQYASNGIVTIDAVQQLDNLFLIPHKMALESRNFDVAFRYAGNQLVDFYSRGVISEMAIWK